VGNDLRAYLSLIVTNRSGERSFSKIKVIEWTKEHHQTKQAERSDSEECKAWTSMCNRNYQYHKQIRYGKILNTILSSEFAASDNQLRHISRLHCL